MLGFWQGVVGLSLDHVLDIRRGQQQHRHDANGSVLKINHFAEPLPQTPPSGYRELILAGSALGAERRLQDPDGNRVRIVPGRQYGVRQVGVLMNVRDLAAHRKFFGEVLQLPEERPGEFRAGESLILLRESPDAPTDAEVRGRGWRYITLQVFKVDQEHARAIEGGAREALAPVTLGTTARISMIRDPDGNWIELSQRASIVGSLE
jgi:lactoylglutathione lyase